MSIYSYSFLVLGRKFRVFFLQPNISAFQDYVSSLHLHSKWHINLCDKELELQLTELSRQKSLNCEPIVITRSLVVSQDLSWLVYVHGHKLDPLRCSLTSVIPSELTFEDFKTLIAVITTSNICPGQPDQRFIEMAESRSGKFLSPRKEVVSILDTGRCVTVNGVTYTSTIRHHSCELLVNAQHCKCCSNYRNNLRAMHSNYQKERSTKAVGTNLRYMKSPQKEMRIRALKNALRNKRRQLQRMKVKLQEITNQKGVQIDSDLQNDFGSIINGNLENISKLPADDFKRIFWQQQVCHNWEGGAIKLFPMEVYYMIISFHKLADLSWKS